jgi:hypothetical protein
VYLLIMVSNGFTNLNNLSYITAVVRIYALYIVSEKCRIKELRKCFFHSNTNTWYSIVKTYKHFSGTKHR